MQSIFLIFYLALISVLSPVERIFGLELTGESGGFISFPFPNGLGLLVLAAFFLTVFLVIKKLYTARKQPRVLFLILFFLSVVLIYAGLALSAPKSGACYLVFNGVTNNRDMCYSDFIKYHTSELSTKLCNRMTKENHDECYRVLASEHMDELMCENIIDSTIIVLCKKDFQNKYEDQYFSFTVPPGFIVGGDINNLEDNCKTRFGIFERSSHAGIAWVDLCSSGTFPYLDMASKPLGIKQLGANTYDTYSFSEDWGKSIIYKTTVKNFSMENYELSVKFDFNPQAASSHDILRKKTEDLLSSLIIKK